VKRLLYALKKRGDKAVIHGLRGKPSVRRIDESIEQQRSTWGRSTASEVSKETVRKWMIRR
jgi:3'-phosphoadenosine 5'-phosphosulfate sulfotransferase (PAPS reductase)/FAD synthetase